MIIGATTRDRLSLVGLCAGLLIAGLLAGCGPPPSGVVSVQGTGAFTRVVFVARAGKANVVTVRPASDAVLVEDAADTLGAGNGCTAVDADTVRCTGANFVELDLGDGNDTATNLTSLPSTINSSSAAGIRGGSGDDVLRGGPAADGLSGDEGSDSLDGGGGDDVLVEGTTTASADAVDGDTFTGGAGRDVATWTNAAEAVTVTLDGTRNDGRSGEGDLVVQVEDVTGGDGADALVGAPGPNALRGGRGNDSVYGREGDDILLGDTGDDYLWEGGFPVTAATVNAFDADTVDGGPGNDSALYKFGTLGVSVDLDDVADDGQPGESDDVRPSVENVSGTEGNDALTGDTADNVLFGWAGDDTLDGGAGHDVLSDGRGEDQLFGKGGNDRLHAQFQGGHARLDGGTEADECRGHIVSDTFVSCELIDHFG